MGLNCQKCSDGVKEINGCEKDSTMGERWEVGSYKLTRCPLKILTIEGMEYMEAYRFYKNGILPMSGGWLDQAQTFIEVIGIIEAEIGKVEKEMQKAKQ